MKKPAMAYAEVLDLGDGDRTVFRVEREKSDWQSPVGPGRALVKMVEANAPGKMRLSRKTILEIGNALETSAAIHVLCHDEYEIVVGKRGGRTIRKKVLPPNYYDDGYVNTGHKAVGDALKLLRRALRLPKNFSFTTASVLAFQREQAQWHARARKRRAA